MLRPATLQPAVYTLVIYECVPCVVSYGLLSGGVTRGGVTRGGVTRGCGSLVVIRSCLPLWMISSDTFLFYNFFVVLSSLL